jgi:hypothetical protein
MEARASSVWLLVLPFGLLTIRSPLSVEALQHRLESLVDSEEEPLGEARRPFRGVVRRRRLQCSRFERRWGSNKYYESAALVGQIDELRGGSCLRVWLRPPLFFFVSLAFVLGIVVWNLRGRWWSEPVVFGAVIYGAMMLSFLFDARRAARELRRSFGV